MKRLHPDYVSRQRQKVGVKLEYLKRLYQKGCSDDLLFRGQAASIYRRCGKENCKCMEGGDKRHGPYPIIRVQRDGKRRQVTLKRNELHFFEMAKYYQQEVANRRKIVELQKELLSMLDELRRKRTLWNKADYSKS